MPKRGFRLDFVLKYLLLDKPCFHGDRRKISATSTLNSEVILDSSALYVNVCVHKHMHARMHLRYHQLCSGKLALLP